MPGTGGVAWTTLVSFGKESSIAGFNNACKAGSKLRSIYWLAVFAVGIGLTAKGMYDVISDYYTYPYTTSTDITHNTSILFPAVSICPLNRVHCGNLYAEQIRLKEAIFAGDVDNVTESNNTLNVLFWVGGSSGCNDIVAAKIMDELDGDRDPDTNYTQSDAWVAKYLPFSKYKSFQLNSDCSCTIP